MIFEAIPSFRDKWKLLQKRFEFLTDQSPRLAPARTRHEREFPKAVQVDARIVVKQSSANIRHLVSQGVRKTEGGGEH